jgi:hypothetical protein
MTLKLLHSEFPYRIQNGAVAKSYMTKGFLIHILYEEMRKYLIIYSMRRPLVINDFETAPF